MRSRDRLFNALAIALLGMTCLLAAGYTVILVNPSVSFNPFPPLTQPALVELPPTVEAIVTNTLTLTPAATITPTPTPTATASPSQTPTPIPTFVVIQPGSPQPSPTNTLSPFPFTVQSDEPIPARNVFNTAGCSYLGIGGQVYDLNGNPTLFGYVIHLEGGGFDANSLSGTQPQFGPTGYGFKLADTPKATTNLYRVQLRDPQNAPISDWVVVNTFDDCSKNVLLVNFIQNH